MTRLEPPSAIGGGGGNYRSLLRSLYDLLLNRTFMIAQQRLDITRFKREPIDGLDQREQCRLTASFRTDAGEYLGKRHAQGIREHGQSFDVRHPIGALDHREKRDADAGALGELLLRKRDPLPQLADAFTQLLSYC